MPHDLIARKVVFSTKNQRVWASSIDDDSVGTDDAMGCQGFAGIVKFLENGRRNRGGFYHSYHSSSTSQAKRPGRDRRIRFSPVARVVFAHLMKHRWCARNFISIPQKQTNSIRQCFPCNDFHVTMFIYQTILRKRIFIIRIIGELQSPVKRAAKDGRYMIVIKKGDSVKLCSSQINICSRSSADVCSIKAT